MVETLSHFRGGRYKQGGLGAGSSQREACPGGVLEVPGGIVVTIYTQSYSSFMENADFEKNGRFLNSRFSPVSGGYVVDWPHGAQVRF